MKKLKTQFSINNKSITLKDYFKEVLKISLIKEPLKRLTGDDGWKHELITALAKCGLISGGVAPCCKKEDWCEKEGYCQDNYLITNEQADKELEALIDQL